MGNDIAIVEYNLPQTVEQVIAQKSLVRKVLEATMKSDTHYGIIPGCKLPTLYKAGSEVILSTFNIRVHPLVEDLSTRDCYRYRVTCQGILPSGEVVGAGVGEASTDEEKYKWRGAVVPAEYDGTPEDRRRIKYSKPSSWNKEGMIQQVRTNPADLANTVLKMAKKRAQIDLTLTCTACSDVFVQDLEELSDELREELIKDQGTGNGVGKPEVKPPQEKKPPVNNTPAAHTPPTGEYRAISEAQGKMLFAKMKNKGMDIKLFCSHYSINDLKELPASEMSAALALIDSGIIPEVAEVTPVKEPVTTEKVCEECGEPIYQGACRNLDCYRGVSLEDK
jgi:hypothetical protein